MIRLVICAALLLALGAPLHADLSPRSLGTAEVAPKPDARVPLGLRFLDETGRSLTLAEAIGGRPALLVFADYTCHALCGPILTFAAAGLEQTGLRAGKAYRLVAIGLDPKDGIDDARAMKASRISSDVADATIALTGDEPSIRAATEAVGYRYVYDAANDQFAHPAAAFVLDPAGRIVRALSALGLDAGDLRLALVDAGHGRIGSLGDHLRLLCYGFDPVRGFYTASILSILSAAAGVTLVCLAAAILWMSGARKRGAPS